MTFFIYYGTISFVPNSGSFVKTRVPGVAQLDRATDFVGRLRVQLPPPVPTSADVVLRNRLEACPFVGTPTSIGDLKQQVPYRTGDVRLFLLEKKCYIDFTMKRKILTYYDLSKVEAKENNESLVILNEFSSDIECMYEKKDMIAYVGDKIFVREKVAEMLLQASKILKNKNSDYNLKVVYGYRHPDIQKNYFDKRKKEIEKQRPNLSQEELLAYTHMFVAAPDVAGHIVGGAVDITISSPNGDLDMGTAIADYSDEEKIQTFYQNISKEQKENRMLLHDIMVQVGFAPFYGEWWHFSYGDKEWAAFYEKPGAIYTAIDFRK